ncbi:helix-turn-helix transcriptional regulator [Thalassococcus sp. BH17M4-6]|uniref:helix-turn-helix transcriptional regulator n=1 Tax=Thalassococcus sp. BH17M4-6 TaxID=3413148 RepID=UPI003BD4BA5E
MNGKPAFLQRPGPINADLRDIGCQTLPQFARGAPWRLTLLHDRPRDLLIWVTRGQGRVIVDGVRRGIGTHNALYLPAGTLFALDLGPQGLAQVVHSPPAVRKGLPDAPQHLRIRDGLAQAELTGHIEAMQREISSARPLMQEALQGYLGLVAVWLQRQQQAGTGDVLKETAAHRLVHRFAHMVVRDFRSDRPMADYAEALDVTPTHLSRACRAACGRTAGDILTERRLYEARSLLSRPRPAIQDIAKSLGFQSAAYFTRFIQTRTGQTPSALRRAALERAPQGGS